jgi:hypothetical protein
VVVVLTLVALLVALAVVAVVNLGSLAVVLEQPTKDFLVAQALPEGVAAVAVLVKLEIQIYTVKVATA